MAKNCFYKLIVLQLKSTPTFDECIKKTNVNESSNLRFSKRNHRLLARSQSLHRVYLGSICNKPKNIVYEGQILLSTQLTFYAFLVLNLDHTVTDSGIQKTNHKCQICMLRMSLFLSIITKLWTQ